MSNFELNLNNAPTLLKLNQHSNGFTIITIATDGLRKYRITRCLLNSLHNTSFISYYNFAIDLSDVNKGEIVSINIPYISNKFSLIKNDDKYDIIQRNASVSGEDVSGFLFKLYYININNAIPMEIDFKATYNIFLDTENTVKYFKFIYFTFFNNVPFYTGIFGDISYNGQYDSVIPFPSKNKLLEFFIIKIETINYVFINVSITPNIVIVNGTSSSFIDDKYNDNDFSYTLIAQNKTLKDNICYIYWIVKKDNEVQKNINDIDIIVEGTVNIKEIQYDITTGFNLLKVDTNTLIDFRLFLKK